MPCQCYAAGAGNSSCARDGQCHCRAGVIGRACDACANVYAEVAPNAGCEGTSTNQRIFLTSNFTLGEEKHDETGIS